MSAVTVKRASLWRESWRAIKASVPDLWLWILIFGLALTFCYYLVQVVPDASLAQQYRQNPLLFKQHPELATQYLHEVLHHGVWFLLIIPVMSVGYYVFITEYLRLALKDNYPEYSLSNYLYWLGKSVWKYLRPILWFLLPVIGMFFYLRSIIRYHVVGPLAILRRGDELKTSWDMTRGNWWRIFGNAFLLGLIVGIIMLFVLLVVGIPLFLFAHSGSNLSNLISSFLQGMAGAVNMAVFSIYTCTVFRILSQEAQQKAAPPASF